MRRVKTPNPYLKRLSTKEQIPASPGSDDLHLKLKFVLKQAYKIAEKAFTEFDFKGEGVVTVDHFTQHHILKKTGYAPHEIKAWLEHQLRLLGDTELTLNTCKTLFFPVEGQLNGNKKQDIESAENRMKQKIVSKFSTVRKAFLSIDYNYDGLIVAEDIIRLFINDNQHIAYEDVCALLRRKGISGKLDFAKFCSWIGSEIEPNHGVFQPTLSTVEANNLPPPPKYPRNSHLPPYLRNSHTTLIEAFHANPQLPGSIKKNILEIFTEKLRQHFSSIQKGFFALSDIGSGVVPMQKLRDIFKTWSLKVTEDELKELYEAMDVNKDGKVNYDDFQLCFGKTILPQEQLYFRQEYGQKTKPIKCIYDGCWDQVAVSSRRFCPLHQALARNKALVLQKSLPEQLGSRWEGFIKSVQRQSSTELSNFIRLLKKYGVSIDSEQADCLLELYEDKNAFNQKVKLDPLINQSAPVKQEISSESWSSDGGDLFPFGANLEHDYKGVVNRRKLPLSLEELAQIVREDNQLAEVNLRLKRMDKDHSGLATVAEITRIFSDSYPMLEQADFRPVLKKFQIQHNKMLINYNRFVLGIRQKLGEFQPKPIQQIRVVTTPVKLKKIKTRPTSPDIKDKISPSEIDKILGISTKSPVDFKNTITPLKRKLSPLKREQEMITLATERARPKTPDYLATQNSQESPEPYIKPSLRRFQQKVPRRAKSSLRLDTFLKRNKSTLEPQPTQLLITPQQLALRDFTQKIAILKAKMYPEWREIYREIQKMDGTVGRQDFNKILASQGVYIDRDEWKLLALKCADNSQRINLIKLTELLGMPRWNRLTLKNEKFINKLMTLRNSRSPPKNFGENELQTQIIGKALTERLSTKKDPKTIKKKIMLNWRNLYGMFKKRHGKTGLIPADEFYKALRIFGIEMSSAEAGAFIQGKQINFREFLKYHIGGQALEKQPGV